jgi:hypothetical protein
VTDEELRQKVVEHFTKIDAVPKCPACGHTKWGVVGLSWMPMHGDPGGRYPTVITACLKCAFMASYSAKVLGILP